MPSAGGGKEQQTTVLFKSPKVATTTSKKKKMPPTLVFSRQHASRAFSLQDCPHSKRAHAYRCLASKATGGCYALTTAHLPNTGFQSTYVHASTTNTHTHKHTQAAGRSKHELTEPTVHYITDLVENEEALSFFLLFVCLKSGEPAPLTCLGGRQPCGPSVYALFHTMARNTCTRCFESS